MSATKQEIKDIGKFWYRAGMLLLLVSVFLGAILNNHQSWMIIFLSGGVLTFVGIFVKNG